MNLIIDVGNTYVKFAVFSKGKQIKLYKTKTKKIISGLRELLKWKYVFNKAIISSVGKLNQTKINTLKKELDLIILDSELKLPFINKYKTPKTVGADRLALVSASVKHYNKSNVLIIDAGTCITYDFITSNNHYLGGAISPGIRLRYKALNNLTANLPLLETKHPNTIVGNSTAESIHSGVINGVVKEIDGVVKEYKTKYKDLTVILTGGDTEFLSKQLKSSIFANSNFLLEGLNFILEFNSD
ncbi:type III pantothenate kinase [Ichthyenterobacterium sp. W332]|uniref:Type III pantothenate kinase n=1 Tax=Microcosmobacter mediterraneus TaxID=3075607 RepID=A0ABU2YK15_9FLAO|nr:type III pantothenate kinase [Ichthyenterobacterium sp. W332]MDT0558496.1 type III pantothenate kinase [Ichthyenterobacterium sp. W332]